jgi:hypothetical protein
MAEYDPLRSIALRKSSRSRVEATRRRNVHIIEARTIREHSREEGSDGQGLWHDDEGGIRRRVQIT